MRTLCLYSIRRSFLKCVTELIENSCGAEASAFVHKIAVTSIRHDTTSHEPEQCVNFDHKTCSYGFASGGMSNVIFYNTILIINIWIFTLLTY